MLAGAIALAGAAAASAADPVKTGFSEPKTGLFALIVGNLRPSAANTRFQGRRIDGPRPDRANCLGIARAFQIVSAFAELSVLENGRIVMLGAASDLLDDAEVRQAYLGL